MLDDTVYEQIDRLTQSILNGADISPDDGLYLLQLEHDYLPWLMADRKSVV